VIVRGTRRSPQRTALGAAKVVCAAAPATSTDPRQMASWALSGARAQGDIHGSGAGRCSEAAAPVAEVWEPLAPVVSLESAAAITSRVNPMAGMQQTARGEARRHGHRRGAAFAGATAACGTEQRQRRRLGAKLQRSAFAPRVESYDPSRLRTVIQAGQQRANKLRVSNGRRRDALAASGSSVCRALCSTRGRCLSVEEQETDRNKA